MNDERENEDESIYALDEIENSLWDVEHPEYQQTHLLRFEIDRTKTSGKRGAEKLMKITDIDLWLSGNRHSVS